MSLICQIFIFFKIFMKFLEGNFI